MYQQSSQPWFLSDFLNPWLRDGVSQVEKVERQIHKTERRQGGDWWDIFIAWKSTKQWELCFLCFCVMHVLYLCLYVCGSMCGCVYTNLHTCVPMCMHLEVLGVFLSSSNPCYILDRVSHWTGKLEHICLARCNDQLAKINASLLS